MKNNYDVIFCILTYKNELDLLDFLKSVQDKCLFKYKCIIVNSFFDELTKDKIKAVADKNGCDFINVPNKGYGAGNNRAIEFALDKYQFEYLVVSNPDTIIKVFDLDCLKQYKDKSVILAPNIVCASGKKQNPAIVKYNRSALKLIYFGYKNNKKLALYRGLAINKIRRLFFLAKKNNNRKIIFQAHGSFVIFTKGALEKLVPVYDENIFLFCEEMDLAFKAKSNGIDTIYVPDIDVYHKEDGSMKLSNLNLYNEIKKSCIYCSEKWGVGK